MDERAEPIEHDDTDETAYDLLQRGQALLDGADITPRPRSCSSGPTASSPARRRSSRRSAARTSTRTSPSARARRSSALLELDPSAHYAHFALGQSLKRLGPARARRGTHLRLAVALSPGTAALPRRARRLGPGPGRRAEPRSPSRDGVRVVGLARAGRASQNSPTIDFASSISPRSAAASASRHGTRSSRRRSSSSGPSRSSSAAGAGRWRGTGASAPR